MMRAAPLLLGAWLAIGGCGARTGGEEKAAEPVIPVRAEPLGLRTFEDAVEANGAWRSPTEAVVAAPFAGVVESLSVRAGDRVSAGQALGTVITLESHAALRGAAVMERQARDPVTRAEASQALQLAERDLVRVALIAGREGVVVRRTVEPGGQVAEGAEVLAVVPWEELVFEAHVPQEQRARIRPGLGAMIREQGQPPRAARVQRVLPVADPADQSTLVWLTPETLQPVPQLDHFGIASIAVGASHQATAVPDSAVVEDDLTGEKRVALVDSTMRVRWTPVILGAGAGGWDEVRSPAMRAGARVVVEGQRGLPDGVRVRWAP